MNRIEGQVRIPSGCAIAGMICRSGRRFSGERITDAMKVMHERSNGLGGGFAAYGIYPEHKECYAFHVFFDGVGSKRACEDYLEDAFEIADMSKIPTRRMPEITGEPLIWRYFVFPKQTRLARTQLSADEYIVRSVFEINTQLKGCYVFSSGRNMGVFKAVGYPEDVGRFYRLEEYEGYAFTAHGRYPTNTPGWWGGAHPFALLGESVVHNGEISSYDANRRFIEMFGYKCTLLTDTEVITYIIDYLVRRQRLTLEETASVIAAPFWSEIEKLPDDRKKKLTYLRSVYASLLITGPFSIILGFDGGLMALNDRLKLRSMVVGENGDMAYIASEESAIRSIDPCAQNIWSPVGGEPVIFTVKE